MPTTLGVYFTRSHCHAVLSKKFKKHYDILTYQTTALTCEDDQESVLFEIMKHFRKMRGVVLGISHHEALIQNITVDQTLTDSEIIRFLKQKSHTEYLDYEKSAVRDNFQTLRVVSVNENLINHYQRLFTKVGISLEAIDLDLFALRRFAKHFHNTNRENLINNHTVDFCIAAGLSIWHCDQ